MKAGSDQVEKFIASGSKSINGWQVGSWFGDRAFCNGNWLQRAVESTATPPSKPRTRLRESLASGEKIDAGRHNYTMTFPAGQLPPVNAFWSVTMYSGKSQLLIENPINRYLINSPMLPSLQKNADGSRTAPPGRPILQTVRVALQNILGLQFLRDQLYYSIDYFLR
jgi:hypothetical protein